MTDRHAPSWHRAVRPSKQDLLVQAKLYGLTSLAVTIVVTLIYLFA
ncbi:MAG: hypothetical protein GKR89_23175 [Candidatus Latescibacteria bacterium]|nr:hypothetical protein [Candidatus Latescibacterota bacterium]